MGLLNKLLANDVENSPPITRQFRKKPLETKQMRIGIVFILLKVE